MITPLPEKDSDGQKYVGYEEYCDQYLLLGAGWADITEKDKFLSLGLLAGEGFDPPSLAGKVEIILGVSTQSFSFGNPEKWRYLQLDANSMSLALKPGKVKELYSRNQLDAEDPDIYEMDHPELAASLVHV